MASLGLALVRLAGVPEPSAKMAFIETADDRLRASAGAAPHAGPPDAPGPAPVTPAASGGVWGAAEWSNPPSKNIDNAPLRRFGFDVVEASVRERAGVLSPMFLSAGVSKPVTVTGAASTNRAALAVALEVRENERGERPFDPTAVGESPGQELRCWLEGSCV